MYKRYWDEERETMPREKREEIILAKIKKQLHYVYNEIPFYKELYDSAGVKPDDIRTLEDFTTKIPIVKKNMLRESQEKYPPFGNYVGANLSPIVRVHGSSGTTGKPTFYAISQKDWNHVADVHAMCFWAAGVRPSDRVHLATHFSLFIGSWGSLIGVERIGATAFPIGSGETERQLNLLWHLGNTVLVSTPSYGLHMLETARNQGRDTAASPLRMGIFIGEPGAGIPATKRAIGDGWGISVADCATTSEMTPWTTNCECEERTGMHVFNDAVYTEIVSKDNPNEPVPEMVGGGLVYTHLERESQPMIRFWSGDESRMTNEPCACGRTYPRLPDGVYGRLDDMLIIRGANVYPSAVQKELLEVPGTGVEFRILLQKKGHLDHATIEVEYDPIYYKDTAGAELSKQLQELEKAAETKLKNATGIRFDIRVLEPETLERAISKAKRVFDERGR
jgi:phenylacetate-CoA ligase